jgi:uncharacterized cupredoxin-like copper-binding protein
MRKGTASVAVAIASASFAAGCGDDDEAGGGEVNVVLSEWVVEPEQDSVDAGEVTFVADNEGGEPHELVVVEAASADELPVDDEGAFDEQAFGEENVLGEVEDVEPGDTKELTLDLEPGDYVFLCNIVEEPGEMEDEMEPGEEPHRHFAQGMYASFTVE